MNPEKMIQVIYEKIGCRPSSMELIVAKSIVDYLHPIPYSIDRVRDSQRTTWRRSVDDPEVWTTSGRSRVATSRKLWDTWGPLTWEGHGE